MRIQSFTLANFATIAFFFAVLFSATALRADVVVMTNGDKFTGTVVKLEDGKLTLKPPYADPIALAWDQVASVTTTQPLVLPAAQKNLSVTAMERTAGGMVITTSSGTVTLPAAEVKILRSPADQQTYEASLHPGWSRPWAGAVNVNFALARGNSQLATFGSGLNLARKTLTDKTSLYLSTLYSRNAGLTTASTTAGGLRYDHNLNPHTFIFGTGDFSSNGLQNLDLRSIIGGGFGWHAIAAPRQTLDILGGLVWTREKYSPSPTNKFAALDLGEQFTSKIGAGSVFTEQAFFYPDLQKSGNYQFSFDTSLGTKIWKAISWQTTFSDRYTSFPPTGTKGNDLVLTTGLGITLDRK
jgi:putative salt-induced outer membrane protein YdiY